MGQDHVHDDVLVQDPDNAVRIGRRDDDMVGAGRCKSGDSDPAGGADGHADWFNARLGGNIEGVNVSWCSTGCGDRVGNRGIRDPQLTLKGVPAAVVRTRPPLTTRVKEVEPDSGLGAKSVAVTVTG